MNTSELGNLLALQYNSKVFLNLKSERKLFIIKTKQDLDKIPSYEIKQISLRANNDTLELYLDVE